MRHYWEDFRDVADLAAFRLSSLTARDGYRLDLYECGSSDASPCLIMPPPGVPFLVLAGLAQALGCAYHVISWEMRGSAFTQQESGNWSCTIEDYAADIGEIAASRNLKKARIITWCESFNLLPYLDSHADLEIEQAVNISPAVYDKRHRTPVALANESFLATMIAGDAAVARQYYDNYRILSQLTQSNLDAREKTLAAILALATSDFDSVMRFAMICHHFQQRANRKKSQRVANANPALFLHCQDDKILHYKGTLSFFESLQCGKLLLNSTGGHYSLFHQPEEVARDIRAFFASGVPA